MTDLVLPSPNEVTVASLPALVERSAALRERIREERNVDAARELHRQLAALTRYVNDKRVRAALEGEQRLAEVLIGQLLGPAVIGRPPAKSNQVRFSELSSPIREDFRRLASSPERVEELVRGGVTQRSQILRRLEHEKRAAEPPPLITLGEYPVLLADPPWRYQFAETKSRAIENQYPTMSLDAICDLAPPAEHNAVLYLWATSPKLEEALAVLKAWRFNYRTNLVWVKDRVGMGYWARQRHELLLVGVRGDFSAPLEELRPDSVITAPRGEHSAKPEAVHEMIERCWPGLPKVELFARQTREGWATWGHEAEAA